jgi:hypothetical protein
MFAPSYEEVDGGEVYLMSETIVQNDMLVKERISSIKKGKNPITFHLLVVEKDEIIIDIPNQ